MHPKKIILAGLMALLLLSLATTTASALRSIASSETLITLLSTALVFGSEIGVNVTCSVGTTITLRASSFAKRENQVIGNALFKVLNPREECRGGKAKVTGGPFAVIYLSFNGTLPRIEGLNLKTERVQFLVEIEGGLSSCEYITNALGLQLVNPATGAVLELRGERNRNEFRLESISSRRLGGLTCARVPSLTGVFLPVRAPTISLI